MSVYLVVATDGVEAVMKNVQKQWPDRHCVIKHGLILISAPGISTPNTIKKRIGIVAGEGAPSGLILLMKDTTIAGVLPRTVVDWYLAANDA